MNIEKTYHVPFPVSRVYAAWVSSNAVIAPATGMDINPVVGGHYRLVMEIPDFSSTNEGTFLEIELESRMKYTWEWDSDGNVTEIAVDFAAEEDGCRVSIVHAGFTDEASFNKHAARWDSYFDGLIGFLKDQRDQP
ncbi:MAG: SRPBCC domain-containing protein [Hyphomicrobiales bacterium]|nr:SRPBCC domain-containing protein [Hyphomicrobiales bacterium]MCP5000836.1 SRPBCC domain-containing protein [Hyphomicrobiales bacterium]